MAEDLKSPEGFCWFKPADDLSCKRYRSGPGEPVQFRHNALWEPVCATQVWRLLTAGGSPLLQPKGRRGGWAEGQVPAVGLERVLLPPAPLLGSLPRVR